MKRYGNLWGKITDRENIRQALYASQDGKKHYKEVIMVNKDPERYINDVRDMLIGKTFRNAKYDVINRLEGRKIREIKKLPYYPDRIIHHAIMQVMQPIWMNNLIKDTWQSLPGRGVHKGVLTIRKALRDFEGTKYALKMDVSKYYPSIDNEIMKSVIRRKIKDPDLLWLLDEIINSTEGLPIGNYISQIMGNLYLSEYDHMMKEQLHLKYYFRYCDDILILSGNKEDLHKIRRESEEYLLKERKLSLKDNWQVFPVDSRGIDFLGYRFFHGYTLVRKSIAMSFKRAARIKSNDGYIPRIMSYLGWMRSANCKHLVHSVMTSRVISKIKTISEINRVNPPELGGLI